MSKIIFLDVDGPMIPMRAFMLPDQGRIHDVFDPCATSLLNHLISDTGAKVVISSTWRRHGLQACWELLSENGINPECLHPDWETPRVDDDTRTTEIFTWLQAHPDIWSYVAFDDERLDATILPGFIQCDMYEGLSFRNYLEARVIFEAATKEQEDLLYFLRRKEIWRAARMGDDLEKKTIEMANELFPVPDGLAPHWYRD